MVNGSSYLRLTSRAKGLNVGENSQAKLDISARAGSATSEALGNVEYPFIAITPRSTLTWSGSTWSGPIYRSNRTKQSDAEVPGILKLWGMWSTPSLPSLPGPLWPGMVASDRVLSMGQIELNRVLMLNWIVWNRTVWQDWIAWNGTVFFYI